MGSYVSALRWIFTGLLAWGLFTGIAYVLTPLVTDGWGNSVSSAGGLVLTAVCAAGLLAFDPRSR